MTKKEIFETAEANIYHLFTPQGVIPRRWEVREVIKWIYLRGREHGIGKRKLQT